MSPLENDSAHWEGWDPALWTIGTVIGAAILVLVLLPLFVPHGMLLQI